MIRISTCALLLFLAAPLTRAEPPATGPATTEPSVQQQVDEILRQLSSRKFSDREKATRAIADLPPEAYAPLHRVAIDPSTSFEVRSRLEFGLKPLLKKSTFLLANRRRIANHAWHVRFLRDCYKQDGLRDPRWNALVDHAFDLLKADPSMPRPASEKCLAAFQKAADAGCNDPYVLYFIAFTRHRLGLATPQQTRDAARHVIDCFEQSTYPAYPRFNAYLFLVDAIQNAPADPDDDKAYANYYFDQAAYLWPEVVKTPGMPEWLVGADGISLLKHAINLGHDRESAIDTVTTPVDDAFPRSAVAQLLDGQAYMFLAESFYPGEPDRAKEFAAAARIALEKAADLDPFDSVAPSIMIEDQLLAHSKLTAEQWFQRAITANPDNFFAFRQRLVTLRPAWGGSHQEMLKFGRECLVNPNWHGRIPLLLVLAHKEIAAETGNAAAYLGKPKVWSDIATVYNGLIQHGPDPLYDRSEFLRLAVSVGKWDVAAEQAKLLGETPDLLVFRTPAKYQQLRETIAEHLHASAAASAAATRPTAGIP